MREYIPYIKENGMDGKLLGEIINQHKEKRAQMMKQYERYKASIDGVPILDRNIVKYDTFDSEAIKRIDDKVNNQLNNGFDAEIVDTKVGYLFGHPISYHVDENETLEDTVQDFVVRNNAEDADSEAGKKAAICGYAARLLYVDLEGQTRMRNIDPWETIIIAESDISEPSYAIRYFESAVIENGERKTVREAEFYDEHYIWFFRQDSGGYEEAHDIQEHIFDYCPLFGIPNNEEMQGDAEKVLKLIDAYDRTLSDASNEIEQYRLAYLVLKGMGLDEEGKEELKKSGVFQLMDKDEDVSYLTKDVNGQLIEDHLNRLENNILRFAKSVNFADEQFSGNSSGIALKFKLMALENKCVTMERKFSAALRYQFKVLCSAWQKRGKCIEEDYLKIWMQFKRNLPANVIEEADASLKLKGIVSEATRLAMLSFVDDVDHELYHLQQDMQGYVDLDNPDLAGSVQVVDEEAITETLESSLSDKELKALNGAQITSVLKIVENVKSGVLSTEQAVSLLVDGLQIGETAARRIVSAEVK
ncbi:phage portal protein [Mammaliicoccus sciuri]